MKKMIKRISSFTLILSAVCLLTGSIHFYIYRLFPGSFHLEQFLNDYLFNFLFTLAIGIFLIFVNERWSHQLGFAYMGGMIAKFLFFFAIIYPGIREDGTISKVEFADFFIPFTVCLLTEILFLIRLLKN